MPLETHWTLTFLIGTPIWILVLIALVVLGVVGWRRRKPNGSRYRNDYDGIGDMGRPLAITCLVVFVIFLAVALSPAAYYPYKAEFHQWRTVSGRVAEVGKRLIAQDKSMSERYVLVIDGQPYGVDDTRASLVKVGDTVTISCHKDWQYAATPGDVCRWVA